MIWAVSLIFVLLAYFLVKSLHSRHIARCEYDDRTSQRLPDSVKEATPQQTEFHEQTKAITAEKASSASATSNSTNPSQRVVPVPEPMPAPHDSPSLLYAGQRNGEKNGLANGPANSNTATNRNAGIESKKVGSEQVSELAAQSSTASNEASTGNTTLEHSDESMDFTAETATLSQDEVGTPANAADYDSSNVSNTVSTTENSNDQEEAQSNNAGVAAAATAAVAGIAVASASSATVSADAVVAETSADTQGQARLNSDGEPSIQHNTMNQAAAQSDGAGVQHHVSNQSTTDAQNTINQNAIDLELGDSTYNDADELDTDDHDELLDFGDLTADISEMLKELNLREDDSPRLDIDQEEFKQLKTGEPGEVKPEKIENVAGKLRNMLQ